MEHRDEQPPQPRGTKGKGPQKPSAMTPGSAGTPDELADFILDPIDGTSGAIGDMDLAAELPQVEPLADFAQMDFGDEFALQPLPEAVQVPGAKLVPAQAKAGTPATKTALPEPKSAGQPAPTVVAIADEAQSPTPESQLADDEAASTPVHRKFLLSTAPSWLISLLVHVAIIMVLAAITLDPVNKVLNILQASVSESASDIENFDLQGPALDSMDDAPSDEPLSVPTPSITPVVSMPKLETPKMALDANLESLEMNSLTESIIPSSMLSSTAMAQMSTALNSRSSASKSELLEKFGGNAASEKAVAMALKWLADHQARDGGWNFTHNVICRNQCDDPGELSQARNGATAMALLPFLGAGQTHIEGQYKNTVKAGLGFLINRMKVESKQLPQGSWHEPGGSMYSHGLAAITVCEAYAMTQDPDLLQPAQLSLNYLINAQDPRGGGWRYSPGQPGDTSVVGWCVMALKSGKMGHLVVPQSTFYGAANFLDFVSTNKGAYYGYDEPTAKIDGRHATTAVGLLCRMYMGVPKESPGIQEGVQLLSKRGPSTSDLYYSYYATQVLRQNGGPEWEKWNTKMRDDLIKIQVTEGHAAGSWSTKGSHSEKGGRLYSTSLATMILEVYYRHMPLYSEKSSIDDFEI